MAFLFGKKKKAEAAPDPQAVLERISAQLESSDKRQEHLEKQGANLRQQAKQLARNKQKQKALQVLKRAKAVEAQAAKVGAMSTNLRTIQGTIQDSFALGDYVGLLKDADKVLANAVKVEDVEELRDNLDEHMAAHQEISDLIATPIGPVQDDGELDQELDDLLNEDDEEEIAPAGPARPVRPAAAAATTDEDEMANLMAGFA
jgi:hypothetical protein